MFLSPSVAEHMDGWWKGNPAKVLYGFSCCWSDYLFFLPMLIVSIVLYVITFFSFGVTSLRMHSRVIFAPQNISFLGTCRDCLRFSPKIRFGGRFTKLAAIPLIDV
jgi:hypothetical protein